ncbi:MAG: hypothetical protein Q8941_04790 [Bacteroidota bacterium]|nr:hypothetical protein [Bacteroidota bacterium]
MANFTTRVELRAAALEDYEKLNEEMAKQGFRKRVQMPGQPVYQLPTGEYNFNEDFSSVSHVLDLAKIAAANTGKEFSVLVTKADGNREWFNLDAAT